MDLLSPSVTLGVPRPSVDNSLSVLGAVWLPGGPRRRLSPSRLNTGIAFTQGPFPWNRLAMYLSRCYP